MYRHPATTDPGLMHLWTDVHAEHTVCGVAGELLPTYSPASCLECLNRYGAELAAAFSHLPWLATERGMTRHAFDPDTAIDEHGRIRPICHIRSYQPDQLAPTRFLMRCPHCLRKLADLKGIDHA